jgi:hypothetical protein
MPAIATFLVSNAQTAGVVQKPYLEGLNYPIALISVCVVIGIIYIKSDKKEEAHVIGELDADQLLDLPDEVKLTVIQFFEQKCSLNIA